MEMAAQESCQEVQEKMRTPKPHPAKRGYVSIVMLIAVICLIGMGDLHWSLLETAVILIVGVAVSSGLFSLPHRGVNREIRRRKLWSVSSVAEQRLYTAQCGGSSPSSTTVV